MWLTDMLKLLVVATVEVATNVVEAGIIIMVSYYCFLVAFVSVVVAINE